jgi:hypothetical protein
METPEYESVPFGEPSRPSSLDMELDMISEDLSMLASPHDLVDYHFFLMESVSVCRAEWWQMSFFLLLSRPGIPWLRAIFPIQIPDSWIDMTMAIFLTRPHLTTPSA